MFIDSLNSAYNHLDRLCCEPITYDDSFPWMAIPGFVFFKSADGIKQFATLLGPENVTKTKEDTAINASRFLVKGGIVRRIRGIFVSMTAPIKNLLSWLW